MGIGIQDVFLESVGFMARSKVMKLKTPYYTHSNQGIVFLRVLHVLGLVSRKAHLDAYVTFVAKAWKEADGY
jgi:hypothetical protein